MKQVQIRGVGRLRVNIQRKSRFTRSIRRFVKTNGVLSGDNLAAEMGIDYETIKYFLAGLPAEWVQEKLHLYTTGINQCGVTNEQLEAKGLFRPAKNIWTLAEQAMSDE